MEIQLKRGHLNTYSRGPVKGQRPYFRKVFLDFCQTETSEGNVPLLQERPRRDPKAAIFALILFGLCHAYWLRCVRSWASYEDGRTRIRSPQKLQSDIGLSAPRGAHSLYRS